MGKINVADLPVGSQVEITYGRGADLYERRTSTHETFYGRTDIGAQWWDGYFALDGRDVQEYADQGRVRVLRTGR